MELLKRNKKIRKFHEKGHSFADIASWDWVGLSSERVRQICLDIEDKGLLADQFLKKYKNFLIVESDYGKILSEIAELGKEDRSKETVAKRQALIRYLHDKLGLSFYKIALLLHRHHTSITHLYYE